MRTPHKHAEIIKAWADGAQVQCRNNVDPEWKDIGHNPCWFEEIQYRIKPEPKPDLVYYGVFDEVGNAELGSCFTQFNDNCDHIKLTFDGETGKLKSAEVL